MNRTALLLLVVVTACAAEPADVPAIGDYQQWKSFETYGHAPGHGDTYRIIFANDLAETYRDPLMPLPANEVGYPEGTAIVKEVYDRNADGTPGSLRVIEFMRRIGTSKADQLGWVFTAASKPGASETVQDFCFRRCHLSAPFDGAWFDYNK
jgi:hypothetical protein